MRINKYIASCGVASRRKAEELILNKKVKVNGRIIEELSFQVDEKRDIVEVDGERISLDEKEVYILLNKPEGYITTVKDQFDRPNVIDLLSGVSERVYPVGRLDYETSGLLLLTNDGDLTFKLTHPKHEIDKTYIAMVKGELTSDEIQNFKSGLYIEDYKTAPAKLRVLYYDKNKDISKLEIKIHEGKNRQVRKMCKAINHPVLRLKRVAMGKITLNDCKVGEYRHLTEAEVNYLKSIYRCIMLRAKYINKITEVNKIFLDKIVQKGDIVIDATMGNGYDTIYLGNLVGENGKVYAFDVQEEAIKSTKKKVERDNMTDRVELILDGHQNLDKYVKEEVSCVVFNLGYLPRAKHVVITKPDTTLEAIKKSLKLLKPNGIISIAAYIGHEGGLEEKNYICEYLDNLNQNEFNVLHMQFTNQINNPPQLILIEKKGDIINS